MVEIWLVMVVYVHQLTLSAILVLMSFSCAHHSNHAPHVEGSVVQGCWQSGRVPGQRICCPSSQCPRSIDRSLPQSKLGIHHRGCWLLICMDLALKTGGSEHPVRKRCPLAAPQCKRTNIGIALITNPSVLFMDEPTAGLDSYTSNEVSHWPAGLLAAAVLSCVNMLLSNGSHAGHDAGEEAGPVWHDAVRHHQLPNTVRCVKQPHRLPHALQFFTREGCRDACTHHTAALLCCCSDDIFLSLYLVACSLPPF